MTEDHHPDLRSEIASAARSLGVADSELRNVGPHRWQQILASIAEVFLAKGRSQVDNTWWWECLKQPVSWLTVESGPAYRYLARLVPGGEVCWLLAEETLNGASKKWVFEGRVDAIQRVLSECSYFEYYLVSKRRLWLLAENHHGVLIAAGSAAETLSALAEQIGTGESSIW